MRNRGFSIAEVVVALMIISIGLIAAARINPTSYRGAAVTKNRLNAMRIARNVVEKVRTMPFAQATESAAARNQRSQEAARLGQQIQSLMSNSQSIQVALIQASNDFRRAQSSPGGGNFNTNPVFNNPTAGPSFGESIDSATRALSGFQGRFNNAGLGDDGGALDQSLARIQNELAGMRGLPPSQAAARLDQLGSELNRQFSSVVQRLNQQRRQLAAEPSSRSQVGTFELDPNQFQPAVPPETAEGNRVGAEFRVTRVAVSIPGENASAGTVTVTLQWNDVGGSEKDDSKTLTLTTGIQREP